MEPRNLVPLHLSVDDEIWGVFPPHDDEPSEDTPSDDDPRWEVSSPLDDEPSEDTPSDDDPKWEVSPPHDDKPSSPAQMLDNDVPEGFLEIAEGLQDIVDRHTDDERAGKLFDSLLKSLPKDESCRAMKYIRKNAPGTRLARLTLPRYRKQKKKCVRQYRNKVEECADALLKIERNGWQLTQDDAVQIMVNQGVKNPPGSFQRAVFDLAAGKIRAWPPSEDFFTAAFQGLKEAHSHSGSEQEAEEEAEQAYINRVETTKLSPTPAPDEKVVLSSEQKVTLLARIRTNLSEMREFMRDIEESVELLESTC
ncbi:hypothetical protein FLONG3_3030 [Fusarium longipes]|uniref:Uncharacterized protein n=1 Tax=Fusarium longipes TaxID=694270 RepID=A0A395T2D2_9HYPO|nr:hypothetical protein FLONG3_3030 [Fusarium longipes]